MPREIPRFAISLRTLFLSINLVILALPILAIASVRLFENVIHRQTEAKLISEGVYVQALYLNALDGQLRGKVMHEPLFRRVPDAPPPLLGDTRPYSPTLDIARQGVLPPAPEGRKPITEVHPFARAAGRSIQPILKKAQLQNLSGVRVLDATGVVVATTGAELWEDLSNREEIARALEGHYASVFRARVWDKPPPLGTISRHSKIRVFVAMPMLKGDKLLGVVYLSRTSLSPIRSLVDVRYGVAIALIVAATLTVSLLAAVIVIRPLDSIIGQARRISDGESGVSLAVSGHAPREAHQVARALSTMVEKMNERMTYVGEFTRAVSHEFKTPLASIQGAIELLKDGWGEMTEEERERFLTIIDSDVRRMDRLVKRLIKLARIETSLPAESAPKTDLVALAERLIHAFEENGQKIKLEKTADSAMAEIETDMAETMLINLIENAFSHGEGKEVTVAVGKGPTLSVKDKGPGISPGNLPRVFDRFFTTARKSGGTGLGLSMVKAIAQAHDAKIEVESDENGTVFTVVFNSFKEKKGK